MAGEDGQPKALSARGKEARRSGSQVWLWSREGLVFAPSEDSGPFVTLLTSGLNAPSPLTVNNRISRYE